MGLIRAAMKAAGSTLADQWKEQFYCDALSADILAAKGEKRTSGHSFNTKGESNIITDGSYIAVAEGQCMMIVEDGKVLEVCAEPGAYIYDTGTSPSVFGGSLMEGLEGLAKEMWERFQYGGGTGKDQRINTELLVRCLFGLRIIISVWIWTLQFAAMGSIPTGL